MGEGWGEGSNGSLSMTNAVKSYSRPNTDYDVTLFKLLSVVSLTFVTSLTFYCVIDAAPVVFIAFDFIFGPS